MPEQDEVPILSQADRVDGSSSSSSCRSCDSIVRFFKNITIEPVILCYVLGGVMISTITTNLLLDKICLEDGYTDEICRNLSDHKLIEADIQEQVTNLVMYGNLIYGLPSILYALFLGSWSDANGRKVPILLPVAGNFLSALIFVVIAYYPSLPSTYILFTSIPRALTGGLSTLLMGCFSYISDITKFRSRTTRIALVDLSFSLGSPIGLLISDVLYYKMGYAQVFIFSGGVYLFAFLYCLLRVQDTRGRHALEYTAGSESNPHDCNSTVVYNSTGMQNESEVSASGVRNSRECDHSAFETHNSYTGTDTQSFSARNESGFEMQNSSRCCQGVFDVDNVRRSFATTFKSRPNKGRMKILLIMLAMCLMVFEFGDIQMEYLYTKRLFNWTYNQFVELSVTQLLLQLIVTSILLPLLSYKLQVEDSLLLLLGCVSKVSGLIIMGFAPQPWTLYLSALISSVGVFPLVISRSLISKTVPPEELGQVFAVLASFESVIPLGSGPTYTALYNGTLRSFPGTIYFLSASLYIAAGTIYIWVFLNRLSTSTSHTQPNLASISHIHADEVLE